MSAQFDWNKHRRNRGGWVIEIWPLSNVRSKTTTSHQPRRWEVEPSGYVQQGEVHAVEPHSTANEEFEQQKAAFNEIPPLILAQHQGQFVASRNGTIVDHDTDLASLTRRFREHYGRVPVYITRVGRTARMPTPFLR